MLDSKIYHQCDTIPSTDISNQPTNRIDAGDTLVCATTNRNRDCCRNQDNLSNNPYGGPVGEWYFPDGSAVPRTGSNSPFHRIGGHRQVRLARVNTDINVPFGLYRCEVPDESDGRNYSVSIIIFDGLITGQS